jgi:hypothetical protein
MCMDTPDKHIPSSVIERVDKRHTRGMAEDAKIKKLIDAAEKARVVLDRIEARDREYELRTISGQVSPA